MQDSPRVKPEGQCPCLITVSLSYPGVSHLVLPEGLSPCPNQSSVLLSYQEVNPIQKLVLLSYPEASPLVQPRCQPSCPSQSFVLWSYLEVSLLVLPKSQPHILPKINPLVLAGGHHLFSSWRSVLLSYPEV